MAWDSCRKEVEASGDHMCPVDECAKVQSGVDHRCHDKGWPAGTPFGIYHPDGSLCFCCCSCFAYGTQIQYTENDFKSIEEFIPGDPVLAAGTDLNWTTHTVDLSSGLGASSFYTSMIQVKYANTGEEDLELIVTGDHLFLMEDGKLAPASVLKAGDKLRRADKSTVNVTGVFPGEVNKGVHHISTGKFTGSLDGHLLNSNQVVTADMSVKLEFQVGNLDRKHLVRNLDKLAVVGSDEYNKNYSKKDLDYMASPADWPQGFIVKARHELINIPVHAYSFITEKQARSIMDSSAPRRDYDANEAYVKIKYVYSQFRYRYPDAVFLFDWNNPMPNAYAFNQFEQNIILLTGGLVRLLALNNEGFALIISHMLARLFGDSYSKRQIECVGPADYAAVADYFSTVYQVPQFKSQLPNALKQINSYLHLMDKKLQEGDPKDRCNAPSVKCRMETFTNAASVLPMPPCADPHKLTFRLDKAVPAHEAVTVYYSENVDPPSAETVENYSVKPKLEISKAEVSPTTFNIIKLTTAEIKPGVEYTLTVKHVISEYDEEIDPKHNSVTFKLKKK